MIFRRREDLLVERFDEQILVFDPNNNLPYILNGIAAFIFMNTDGEMTMEEMAEKVCQEYNVTIDRVLGDIKGLYDKFISKRLVDRIKQDMDNHE